MVLNRVDLESSEEQNEEEENFEAVDSVWQVNVDCEKLVRTASNSIFLFDHAWTFELSSLRSSLIALPSLRLRMAELMDIDQSEVDETTILDRICERVWKFCRYYKVSLQGQGGQLRHDPEVQRWYVLDEVGCRISHSDKPNARIVPFFYTPRGVCYSLLWPLRDLQRGEAITVDYIEHVKDPHLRQFYLIPWQPEDFSVLSIEHCFILSETFFQSHRVQETLPCFSGTSADRVVPTQAYPLLVYSDMALIRQHLTDPRFRLVDSPENAKLLWLYDHFKDFKSLSLDPRNQLINQFPGEQVITVKDLLAAIASLWASTQNEHMNDDLPLEKKLTCDWYPVTFNLVHELPSFVAYFQRQQQRLKQPDSVQTLSPCTSPNCCRRQTVANDGDATQKAYNVWILKPWNLGRGMGICITDNLDQIIRMCDTNPLIASRYVTNPVLFYRDDIQANVKFDVRYVVLLRSIQPLRLYAYNVFWLRFANKPFCLDNFEDYSTHFTVMNYREDDPLKQIHHDEFVGLFNEQYPNTSWCEIQVSIFSTLVDLFTAASTYPEPRGIVPCLHSRAMYAVDLMLEWRSQPTLSPHHSGRCHRMCPVVCEVNYSPDCERACRYHPDFFNHVFGCLFLDDPTDQCNVTRLV